MKTFFVVLLVFCFILMCGCEASNSSSAPSGNSSFAPPLSPAQGTPSPSLPPGSPAISSPPSAPPASPDPIIGGWSLQGTRYSGTASITADGNGTLVAGVLMVTKTITFTWKPAAPPADSSGNRYYAFALPDGTGDTATLSANGTLTSPVLPAGAYLVKEGSA